jgi:SHS2 domain-containing protein
MEYTYLEDIALADTAFEAYGESEEMVFVHSAQAMANVMADIKNVQAKEEKQIAVQADTLTNLLHNYLSELVFLKDENSIVFSEFSVTISEQGKGWVLNGTARGQFISELDATILKTDVKAVTWHQFSIEEKDGNWTARVIVDV